MDRPSSHSQKVPYARKEGQKSLLSKMKDSMRDMLSPSWLTELVHNVKQESPAKDNTESCVQAPVMLSVPSGMQYIEVSPVPILQHGQIGMPGMDVPQMTKSQESLLKSRASFLGNGQPRTLDFMSAGQGGRESGMMASPFQQGGFPPPIAEFTSAQLPLARLTEKSDSVMAHEDALSQRSDGSKSTSGCSSMVLQADMPRQDALGDKRKASEQTTVGHTSPQDQAAKRQKLHANVVVNETFSRRLSDTFMHKPSTSAVSGRPAFNASLFGSPLNKESSLLGSNFHDSNFYPGKTRFGGRSSLSFQSRKNVDLNQSLPGRLAVPVKAFMKAKPRPNPNKEAVTSSTAKRILEALDKMPTPLNDAKQIPMIPRQWGETRSFFSRDRSLPRHRGPPTQNLNISSQASICKNRLVSFAPVNRPKASTSQVPTETVSRVTRQDTVVLSSDASVAPTGKMRRDKSYHKGSSSVKPALEEEDTVILLDLQTEFTLPVSSMPKFSFAAPVSQPKTSVPVNTSTENQTPVNSESRVKQSLNFTFSSPIIEPVPADKPASPQKYGGYQFSSPISVGKKDGVASGPSSFGKPLFAAPTTNGPADNLAFSFAAPANKSSNVDYSFSTAPKPKPKINGPFEPSGGGGLEAASVLKQGSVMDILGGGSTKSSTQSSSALFSGGSEVSTAPALSTLFKSSGWSCGICLINNKDDVDKCVACQTPKPSAQNALPAKTSGPKLDVFAKFQQPSGNWTCDVCLISNKADISKCVACQTQKPGAASSSHSPLVGSIQPGNWVCTKCLIQNRKEAAVCGACKAAKSASTPSSSTSELKKSDSLFAKLKPSGTWECEVCLVQNKPNTNSCVACQTTKPLKSFKHPPGDWTCDTCLVNNKEMHTDCVACNYARPGPPRTQAVPSIAKSYTMSHANSFSMPNTSDTGSISLSSTGGFTFSTPVSSGKTASGFDTSKMNEAASKSGNLATGGYKFNSDSLSQTSIGSGFKFGVPASADSDKSSGFKFGGNSASSDKTTVGFQVGNSDSKSGSAEDPLQSAGFQLAKPDDVFSTLSSSSSNTVSHVFEQKSDATATKDELQTTTSVPGGFNFKPSDSLTSAKSNEADITKTVTITSQSMGGFNFTAVTSTSNLTSVSSSSNSLGSLPFTATKVTDTSILLGTSKPSDSKPALGGFTFGQKPAESITSNPPFNFAQKAANVSLSAKRGREEDCSEPEVKKPSYSFVPAPSSSTAASFQFGASSVASTISSSSLFAFGQKPVTTSTSAGLFAFGQHNTAPVPSPTASSTYVFGGQTATPASTVSTGLPVFGQTNSAAVTTTTAAAAPAPSMFQFGQANNTAVVSTPSFNFQPQQTGQAPAFGNSTPSFNFQGQKTETANAGSAAGLFKFGALPSQPVPATTPSFGSNSGFGSSNTPAFGAGSSAVSFSGNAPATTPAFGATPPAFGSGTSSTGQAAAAFGGGVFGNTTRSAAPAQSGGVFQFGAKPADSSQAAASSGFNFNASTNPAGLGAGSNFNFTAQAPSGGAFTAQPPSGGAFTAQAPSSGAFTAQAPSAGAFTAQAPSAGAFNAFSATPTDRKIKRAVRKIRR